jgi:hypothetical protein
MKCERAYVILLMKLKGQSENCMSEGTQHDQVLKSSYWSFKILAPVKLSKGLPEIRGHPATLIIWLGNVFEVVRPNFERFSVKFFRVWKPKVISIIFPIISVMSWCPLYVGDPDSCSAGPPHSGPGR